MLASQIIFPLISFGLFVFLVDSNFLSMQRQMNNYGFMNLLSSRRENFATGRCVYAHAYFRFESDPEGLQERIRYQGPKSPASNLALTSNNQKKSSLSSTPTNRTTPQSAPSSRTKVTKRRGSENGKKSAMVADSFASTSKSNSISSACKRRSLTGQNTSQRPKKSRQKHPLSIQGQACARSSADMTHYSRHQLIVSPVKQKRPQQPPSTGTISEYLRTGPMVWDSTMGETKVQGGIPYPSPAGSSTSDPSVVTCRSFNALMRLPIPTPITCHVSAAKEVDFETQTLTSPERLFMMSSFLETPSPSKRRRNNNSERVLPSNVAQRSPPAKSPGGDGFRVLFHAAQAVEFSPITIIHRAQYPELELSTPSSLRVAAVTHDTPQAIIATTGTSESSPIMSMVNMDFVSFRQAMDALQQPADPSSA
jgi:hypothetical protein